MPVATKSNGVPATPTTSAPAVSTTATAPAPAPAGTSQPSIDPSNPSSGLAYYDKLRKELRELIARKKQVDKNLEQLEDHIFKFETSYLEETQNGNIVRGFDNYIKGTVARRRAAISDNDRIFSMSSFSFMKAREEAAALAGLSDTAPTPTATGPLKINTKKKNKKRKTTGILDDDSDSPSEVETPGPKRVRISFSGQNLDK